MVLAAEEQLAGKESTVLKDLFGESKNMLAAAADDDGLDDLALADTTVRSCGLDRRGDDVAHARVAAVVAALDADAEDLAGTGVVGAVHDGTAGEGVSLLDRMSDGWENSYTGRPRVILSLPPGAPRLWKACQYFCCL